MAFDLRAARQILERGGTDQGLKPRARTTSAYGLFTGAEGVKTEEQEAIYGGVAGLQYDPCYHEACDTFFNLSETALDQMSDAVADAVATYARSTRAVERAGEAAQTFEQGGGPPL